MWHTRHDGAVNSGTVREERGHSSQAPGPPPHNKYGKSQVHKTRNDLIDTISKVIYRSWLCLPLITHFGQVLFRSFPSSQVAVCVNLLLFPSEALEVLTNPLSEDAPALFCFSHTFFCAISPTVCSLPFPEEKMPATNRKASSQPISFSSLETACHTKPRATWPWTKPPSCSCPQVLCQIPAWTPQASCPGLSTVPTTHFSRGDTRESQCHQHSVLLPPGAAWATAHPKIQWDQRGKWERRQRLL